MSIIIAALIIAGAMVGPGTRQFVLWALAALGVLLAAFTGEIRAPRVK